MTDVEKLKLLTGESSEELLSLLLERAEEYILNYTNRSIIPERLRSTVIDIAVLFYNRQGNEGIASHSEGGVSVSYSNGGDVPDNIKSVLNNYRLGRVGGVVFEEGFAEDILP